MIQIHVVSVYRLMSNLICCKGNVGLLRAITLYQPGTHHLKRNLLRAIYRLINFRQADPVEMVYLRIFPIRDSDLLKERKQLRRLFRENRRWRIHLRQRAMY